MFVFSGVEWCVISHDSYCMLLNRAWIDYTCKVLLGQFEAGLLDCRPEAVLRNLTVS